MTDTGIECFLAVCRYKTGSRAAEALYITQSSLATRLKNLERELGGPLFYRRKGGREMTLTEAGKEFYGLAVEYEKLTEQMRQVCRKQKGSLRVSSYNSVGTYLLPEVYERFLQEYPHIALEIQDMELDGAVRSLLSGGTDIAFTAGNVADPMVVQTPVLSEPMVLICSGHGAYPEPASFRQLSRGEEVYIEWSNMFRRWHQRIFGSDSHPKLSISIMAHLRQFMEREQCWAIVPVSVARGMEADSNIRRLRADFLLPNREISCLTKAGTENREAIQAFYNCLRDAVASNPEIKILF